MALIDDAERAHKTDLAEPISKRSDAVAPRAAGGLHLHLAAMAPQFMDVRTLLPLRVLAKSSGVGVSYSRQKVELPRLPAEQPKLVILQRMGVPDFGRFKGAVRQMVETGWVVVTEFDDHPDLVSAVHGRPKDDRLWRTIRLSHAVQTSTPELAEAFRVHNPEVVAFSNAAFCLGPPPVESRGPEGLRVFFGALNRERFSAQIGRALAPLAERRPDLQFVIVHDKAFFQALGPANKLFHDALPYEQYLEVMGSCDIALLPLEGTEGELYKSDVKFVEASSLGLASIASPSVYAKTILDDVDGVIVREVTGWAEALDDLVINTARRLRIAGAAYGYVARNRMFSAQAERRLDWYGSLWDRRFELTAALSARFKIV